jgi:hypothetical protein
MTLKAQDTDDLKAQKARDIDYPIYVNYNLIRSKHYLPKGGIRWNRAFEKKPLPAI